MFYNSRAYSSTGPATGFIYHNNVYPVYTIHPESVRMDIDRADEFIHQCKDQYVEQFKKNYKPKTVILYSFLIILIGILQIALQITIIVKNYAPVIIANGIWGGIVCTILGILALSLIKWKKFYLIILTFILHIFSILILIMSFIIVNAILLIYLNYNLELNGNILAVYLIMLALGVIAVALIIFYLIMMFRNFFFHIMPYRFGTNIFSNNLQTPVNNI